MRQDEQQPGHQPASDVGTGAQAHGTRGSNRPGEPLGAREHETVERAAGPVGAASGAVAGGTAGTLVLGPIGTAIGAALGAVGGWWAGSAVKEVPYREADDQHYRTHYSGTHRRGRSFEDVSPGYYLGHVAARNPELRGRPFAEIEPELKRIWNADLRARHGEWSDVRDYVRESYVRGAQELEVTRPLDSGATAVQPVGRKQPDLDMGGTSTHHRAEFSDPGPSGSHPEAGFFDRAVGAAEPSAGDAQAGRDDGMGPMMDRGGFREHDEDPHEDERGQEAQ